MANERAAATSTLQAAYYALLGATGAFEALKTVGADRHLPGFSNTLASVEAAIKRVEAELAAPSETAATHCEKCAMSLPRVCEHTFCPQKDTNRLERPLTTATPPLGAPSSMGTPEGRLIAIAAELANENERLRDALGSLLNEKGSVQYPAQHERVVAARKALEADTVPLSDITNGMRRAGWERFTNADVPYSAIYAVMHKALPPATLPLAPTPEMLDALTDRMWRDHTAWTVWDAYRKAIVGSTPGGRVPGRG